jgi:hypothetical protein
MSSLVVERPVAPATVAGCASDLVRGPLTGRRPFSDTRKVPSRMRRWVTAGGAAAGAMSTRRRRCAPHRALTRGDTDSGPNYWTISQGFE